MDFLPGLEPDDDDLAWMITDALAAEGWDDLSDHAGHEPEALAKRLGEAVPAGQEPAAFELMARVPHPDAANVLTVIGRHHPDKKIAKLARKSAYKAASRRAARNDQEGERPGSWTPLSSLSYAPRGASSPRRKRGC